MLVESANEEALLVEKALRTTKTMESEITEPHDSRHDSAYRHDMQAMKQASGATQE